jgi:hypothetical protein
MAETIDFLPVDTFARTKDMDSNILSRKENLPRDYSQARVMADIV